MPTSLQDAQEKVAELGAGLRIGAEAKLAAWMQAMHVGVIEIEMALGMPAGAIYHLRNEPEYREMVGRCSRFIARQTVRQAASIPELFNGQIMPSAATLIEIRDNPYSKGSDRIKAASEFLDRAPDAPKARHEVEERKTVIMLPLQELQNMQQALLEEGTAEDIETYELIRGQDYNMVENGEIEVTVVA